MHPVKTQLKRNLMWCWMLNMCFRRIPMLPFTHLLSINKALLRFQGVVDHQQLLDYGWISSLAPKVATKIMNEPDVDAVFASRLVGKNHVANYENCSRADATSTRSFDNPKHSYNNNITHYHRCTVTVLALLFRMANKSSLAPDIFMNFPLPPQEIFHPRLHGWTRL